MKVVGYGKKRLKKWRERLDTSRPSTFYTVSEEVFFIKRLTQLSKNL